MWYPCTFSEYLPDDEHLLHAVIFESDVKLLCIDDSSSTLIAAISEEKPNARTPRVEVNFVTVLRKDDNSIKMQKPLIFNEKESYQHIKLFASRTFLTHYAIAEEKSIYSLKIVNPYPLKKVVFGATTDGVYDLISKQDWSVDLMINVCDDKVLCRQGDVLLWLNKNQNSNTYKQNYYFDLITIECQPVLQGVITVQTEIVIVKLEQDLPSPLTLPAIYSGPEKDDSKGSGDHSKSSSNTFHMSDYWNLMQYLSRLIPRSVQRKDAVNPVLPIIASSSRIIFQAVKNKFHIGILPVCPFIQAAKIGINDPLNALLIPVKIAKNMAILHGQWVEIALFLNKEKTEPKLHSTRKRWVQICLVPNDKLNMNLLDPVDEEVVYMSPILWFNLNDHPSLLIQRNAQVVITKITLEELTGRTDHEVKPQPPFARELTVSLVQSPHCDEMIIFDRLLEKYFETTRYVQSGDIICIGTTDDVDEEGSKCSYKLQRGLIFFKVSAVTNQRLHYKPIGLLAQKEVSSLYQSTSAFSYVPSTMDVHLLVENAHPIFHNPFPVGFQYYILQLQDIIVPYLESQALRKQMMPSILIVGPRGCGKGIVIEAVARTLNMHLHQIDCYDLLGDTSGSTEAKLKQALTTATTLIPCLMILKNVHILGKNKDGTQDDVRLLQTFRNMTDKLIQNFDNYPVVLLGVTTDSDFLPVEYDSLFLHQIHIPVPSEEQRKDMLDALFVNIRVGRDVKTTDLAEKTPGYVFGDLCALVSRAVRLAHARLTRVNTQFLLSSINEEEDLCLAGLFLRQSDFGEALAIMQAEYSDAIGAPQVPSVLWEDIGGLEEVKKEILDTIQLPLQHPELVSAGLRRSGVLLFGPPGTGKTLLAKAVATECQLHFLSVKGPELLNMYVGQSEENVREVFRRARKAAPCVIFFDELDSLAPNRGRSGDSGGVMDRLVSQLLAELDGLEKSESVYVIGATNRPDLIDPALLRPGRFDKLLFVGVAEDVASQIKILRALTRKFNLSEEVNFEEIAAACPPTVTGADVYALCSDALTNALNRKVTKLKLDTDSNDGSPLIVSMEDFMKAAWNLVPSISFAELERYKQLKMNALSAGKN